MENLSSLVITYGYAGIFLIMTLNSDFIPLFTEVTLPFAGFLASQGKLSIELIILASILGDLIGGTIAYFLGLFLGEKVILSGVKKYGKYVLLKENDYQKTTKLIRKHGPIIVFFAKLIPGLKAWTSVTAGICKVNYFKFIISSIAASIIYNSTLVISGYYLGRNWNTLTEYFNKFQIIVYGLIIIFILWYINHKLKIVKIPKTFSTF